MTDFRRPLHFEPAYKERVWGGRTFQQGQGGQPIGEVWLLHEDQPVRGGPLAGLTLAQLTEQHPAELLGGGWPGQRFPLLIKLLDCQDWLSVQVHPNDEEARRLVGPAELGKTEAWHVLHAAQGATLISGTTPDTTPAALRSAILAGEVSHLIEKRPVQTGETLLVPAGTVHALGPGLLIYEVQQNSDTTYRVYDWDRPASAGRELHLGQSAEVSKPGQASFISADPGRQSRMLAQCPYFVLEELCGPDPNGSGLHGETAGKTPHILTVKSGEALLHTPAGTESLFPYATVLLPAALGRYELSGEFEVLRASLPLH